MKYDVSIVIVCMNNLKNLYPCLDSIKEHTQISYEVWIVAYLFSKENLDSLRSNYPWVQIIESNEIRGFSENNNIALKQAKGDYCFVLNDDTIFPEPVIDRLYDSIRKSPNAAVISPVSFFPNEQIQSSGRPKHTILTYILGELKLWNEQKIKSKFTYKKGIFQSYNLVGAFFLIKTDLFRSLGWFDERYFFCPEDIALSTLVNKKGYKVYVDSNVKIYHIEGGTSSFMKTATDPSCHRGSLIFYSNGNLLVYALLGLFKYSLTAIKATVFSIKYLIHKNDKCKISMLSNWNTMNSIFTKKTPKEIFIKYYNKIKK